MGWPRVGGRSLARPSDRHSEHWGRGDHMPAPTALEPEDQGQDLEAGMTAGPGLQQLHSSSPAGSDCEALLPRLLHHSPAAARSPVSPILQVSACNPVCVCARVCHTCPVYGGAGVYLTVCLSVCLPVVHVFICVSLSIPLSLWISACISLCRTFLYRRVSL